MIHALTHYLHLDIAAAPLHRLWRLATEVKAIIVTAAAGGSVSTAIPPLLALAFNGIFGLHCRLLRHREH